MTAVSRYRSSYAVPAVIMLLALSLARPSMATLPGLKLPEWLEAGVSLGAVPEVGESFEIRGRISARIGKLENARYRFRLPPTLELLTGSLDGTVTLEPGASRELALSARVRAASPDASVSLLVVAPLPAAALRKEIDKLYADKPADELDALRRQLDGIRGDQTVAGMATFSATEREGFGEQEEEAFLDWFRPTPDADAEFALLGARLDPPRGPAGPGAGSAKDLFGRNPKLAELFKKAGKDPAAFIAREDLDHYSDGVRSLKSARPSEAAQAFARVGADEGAGSLFRFAAANGGAIALFAMGKREAAETAWRKLAADHPDEPLARYAHFNLGESCRSRGAADLARREFEAALEIKKAFTIARRRLRGD